MANLPDDIAWLPESRMISLCGITRSTFQSWRKSGLDVGGQVGAYGLDATLTLALLAAVREFLAPKEMIEAWRHLVSEDKAAEMLAAARKLREGERFDLVVEPDHALFGLARTDAELAAAVRHPTFPRRVVVVDAAERVRTVVSAFARLGNMTQRPEQKAPGRPRSADRSVSFIHGRSER